MTFDYATMPLEIWADMLEEEGEDVASLRLWLLFGGFMVGYGNHHGLNYDRDHFQLRENAEGCGSLTNRGDGGFLIANRGHGVAYGACKAVGNGYGFGK